MDDGCLETIRWRWVRTSFGPLTCPKEGPRVGKQNWKKSRKKKSPSGATRPACMHLASAAERKLRRKMLGKSLPNHSGMETPHVKLLQEIGFAQLLNSTLFLITISLLVLFAA